MTLNTKKRIWDLIHLVDVRNNDEKVSLLLWVTVEKRFIPSVANTIWTDMSNYKIIRKWQFACSLMQVRRDKKIPVALLKDYDEAIVTSAYPVFEVNSEDEILPEYLMMWFCRKEFDRESCFYAVGWVRGSLEWEDFCNMKLPVPSIPEQQKLVDKYNVVQNRIYLNKNTVNRLYSIVNLNYKKLINSLSVNDILPIWWRISTIWEYCDIKSWYAFKSDWRQNKWTRVIKISNIIDNSISFDWDCVDSKYGDKAPSFYVSTGDLVIAMTWATTGKIWIIPYTNEKLLVNQRVWKFFLWDSPLLKLPFIFWVLNDKNIYRLLHPDWDEWSAQDNLSPDDIKGIPIVYPSEELIWDFNKRYSNIFKYTTILETEIQELESLKNAIMFELFK